MSATPKPIYQYYQVEGIDLFYRFSPRKVYHSLRGKWMRYKVDQEDVKRYSREMTELEIVYFRLREWKTW